MRKIISIAAALMLSACSTNYGMYKKVTKSTANMAMSRPIWRLRQQSSSLAQPAAMMTACMAAEVEVAAAIVMAVVAAATAPAISQHIWRPGRT